MRKAPPERADPTHVAEERQAENMARAAPTRARPPGAGLPPEVASLLQDRLGIDPAGVPMRTDTAGAQALGAEAYTARGEVAFGAGRYAPHTEDGQRLIAHELTHVAQARPYVQRKPLTPADGLRDAIAQLDQALVELRAKVDDVDDRGVEAMGLEVVLRWLAVEAASKRTETKSAVDAVAGVSLPDVEIAVPLSQEEQTLFDEARDRALTAVTIQRFRQDPTIETVPRPTENITEQLLWQLQKVVEIVHDTMEIATLLFPPEIAVSDEFKVIDLLRKHTNPLHFRWMLRVVESAGLLPRLEAFGRVGRVTYVRDVYKSLMGAVKANVAEPDPNGKTALYQLLPLERTVVLNQPMRLGELAQNLYGDAKLWEVGLLPFNRQALLAKTPEAWLLAGTRLIYAPSVAGEEMSDKDAFLRSLKAGLDEKEGRPYLTSSAKGRPAVVGNVVTYTLVLPAMKGLKDDFWNRADVQWEVYSVDGGERRYARQEVRSPEGESTWNDRIETPQARWVTAKIEGRRGTSIADVSFFQLAVSPEEALNVGGLSKPSSVASPQDYLTHLVETQYRAGDNERPLYDPEIEKVKKSMPLARGFMNKNVLRPLNAVFVSTSDEVATARPLIFAGRNVTYYNFANPDAHDYILVDYTLGEASVYTASGYSDEDAVRGLIGEFKKKAPYPKGEIHFNDVYQIEPNLPYLPVPPTIERVQHIKMPGPTEANGLAAGALRGMSMASLIVGVIGVLTLQPEIAGPAFAAAGFFAAGGAIASISDRMAQGKFEWDLETALDVMDIVTATLSAGIIAEARVAVRGIGTMTLTQKIARGADLIQLGIVGTVHTVNIAKAIASGDAEKILAALGAAIMDGSIVIVVHRSAKALGTMPRGGGGDFPTRRTSFGVGGDEPTLRPGSAPGDPTLARSHGEWIGAMRESGMGPRPNLAPEASPTPLPDRIKTPDEAQHVYEQTLANTNYKVEVGVFHNRNTGEYVVTVGSEFEVRSPFGMEWDGVMHYHPNLKDVLTYRMPAPADVKGAGYSAIMSGRNVTEFVEYPLPGGGRGRTMYTFDARTKGVEIVYQRADGTRVEQSFRSLDEYTAEYGSRTTYIEKGSKQHEWAIANIREYYDNVRKESWDAPAPNRRTGSGVVPPKDNRFVRMDEEEASYLRAEDAIEEGLSIRTEAELDVSFSPSRTDHIRNVLADDGRPVGFNEDVHHIVLENSREPLVVRAQELLEEASIGIHDAANLVALRSVARTSNAAPLNETFTDHGTIHTREYYEAVVRDLEAAAPDVRDQVLREIGERLRLGDYP
ncbi:DUF4157 domain-containing protein [bacterium]|nr:MAG: DUF4157 domain-containing protein [bacterium]